MFDQHAQPVKLTSDDLMHALDPYIRDNDDGNYVYVNDLLHELTQLNIIAPEPQVKPDFHELPLVDVVNWLDQNITYSARRTLNIDRTPIYAVSVESKPGWGPLFHVTSPNQEEVMRKFADWAWGHVNGGTD